MKKTRRLLPIVIALTALALTVVWCSAEDAGSPAVRFTSASGSSSPRLKMKLAVTRAERMQGLKYVKELAADEGMLFVFPEEKIRRFWMKDTYISLDMVFIGRQKRVVGIIHDVPPFTTERQSVNAASMYVIELAGGSARKYQINVGDTVSFLGDIPDAAVAEAE